MKLIRKLFRSENDAPAANYAVLTIVFVVARHGLSYEGAQEFRRVILDASPLDFYFLNPGSFEIFFAGTEAGTSQGKLLMEGLRAKARQMAIAEFGAAMRTGKCVVSPSDDGGFAMTPIGGVVNEAMQAAYTEAAGN